MSNGYVHGCASREAVRLQDQASTLVEHLHSDTCYADGHKVLEAGCGVGAQTRTAETDGVFCYTFFKAVAVNSRARGDS